MYESTPWSSQEFHQNVTRQHLGFMRVSLKLAKAFQITDRFMYTYSLKSQSPYSWISNSKSFCWGGNEYVKMFFRIRDTTSLSYQPHQSFANIKVLQGYVIEVATLVITHNPDKVLLMLQSFQGSGIEVAVLIHGVHLLGVIGEMRAIPCVPIVFDVIRRIENIRTRNFKTPAFGVIRWRHRCRHGARLLFV